MFDTIKHVLSADVASAGTFTVSYPTNRSGGDYTGAHAHKMYAIGADFSAPNDFTLTFNAGDITVTYNGSTTIPSGSTVYLQVERLGKNGNDPFNAVIPDTLVRAPMHLIDLGSPDADDANGYVESQDLTSAGVFSVNTTAAAAIAAAALNGTADVPRNVVASWTGTAVLTVTGTDVDGNTIVESSASGTSLTGKKAFKTVTDISSSANITSLTVGTGDVLGLPVYVADAGYVAAELEDGATKARKPGRFFVHGKITDVSTAGQIYIPVPFAGSIKSVYTALNGAITSGDATITVKTAGGTVGTITVANAGSAAGDVDSLTSGLSNTSVAAGGTIEIETNGGSTNAVELNVVVEIELTAAQQLDGTFVAGVTTKATATTGDVRGTYAPSTNPDGATAFELLVSLQDPANDGVPQYAG